MLNYTWCVQFPNGLYEHVVACGQVAWFETTDMDQMLRGMKVAISTRYNVYAPCNIM